MMDKYIPPELVQSILSALSTISAALIGRLVWHTQQAQRDRRKFFSLHLIFELPIALGIAFFADGVAAHFELSGKVAFATIVAISYMGPRGIEALLMLALKRK
ncbi:phage holin family protein [Sneathiella sp.]|uniref:phage holin family protein n=1 Tax=Sneathiella sp. TaxID=1964365 RepID=UPI002FE21112